MSQRRTVALFAVAWLLSLALWLPLRWVLPASGLTNADWQLREVQGSVWDGSLRGARWQNMTLGDVRVQLQPLPLLLGQRAVRISNQDSALTWWQGRRNGLSDGSGTLFPALPQHPELALQLDMQTVTALFHEHRCAQADGRLRLHVQAAATDLADTPLQLEGHLQCEGEQVRAQLQAVPPLPAGISAAHATVQLDSGEAYQWQLQAIPQTPHARVLLGQAGLQADGQRMALQGHGKLPLSLD